MAFFQKRLRRPADHYRGRLIYFVTVGTEKRAPFFADRSTGRWLLHHLLEIAGQQNFSLHAFCIMPDHIHFLCEGLLDTSDLVRCSSTPSNNARPTNSARPMLHGCGKCAITIISCGRKRSSRMSPAISGGTPCGKGFAAARIYIPCPVHKPSTG